MTKLKKSAIALVSLLSAGCLAAGTVAYAFNGREATIVNADMADISNINGRIDTDVEKYFDESVMYRLPEAVAQDDEISVIVTMNCDSVLDVYDNSPFRGTYQQFLTSEAARAAANKIEMQRSKLLKELKAAGIEYSAGESYKTLFSGFEIIIKASDFDEVNNLLEVGGDSELIVGDRYYTEETQVVTNDVDVYTTGIFDSSNCEYQGDGVVVAVLDTGCDYTHTAFRQEPPEEAAGFDKASISKKVAGTVAAGYTAGLTGDDVYVSKKIPFAYDYADKDSDVAPINESHGTHVAGIIAGQDEEITGVAPNAQLAIMKVFSDYEDTAKTSWILGALEDCVNIGVDIINMSLGTSCGFTRELDNDRKNQIYDRIKEEGISLIAAASNDYNATFGSEKNGNLGLTSNPDFGTVGSPSTYGAALSVASVDGVKTPYLKYGEDIIYFTEAMNSEAKKKNFVDDVLNTLEKNTGIKTDSYDFDYVTIPGIGRSSDYLETGDYYHDKIVLVKRGTTTFEDKVRVALQEKGAAGIIIYNNVSGSISMSVGKDMGAVCSLTQDEGEKLAAAGNGTLHISREQTAGPFMSDFSSWGPTSDLKIKPEITAHGGEIYSCVPGQRYDRMSGTSMAAPNQSGATALIRQYVKFGTRADGAKIFGDLDAKQVTARVNQLMMSTADIVYEKNGLAASVRKQGAGLMNINSAITSQAYLTTFADDGSEMDKTKLELGDDKKRNGVYEMTFAINNISTGAVSYDLGSIVMTEGVSATYTGHGETTVTQEGYELAGAKFEITDNDGCTLQGNTVTVAAGKTGKISVKITLSGEDKDYLDKSFENGMYVEGFITLTANSGATVNLSVPLLAFYGDWTEAPIFDEEYYDTNKDELNAGLDDDDKLMPDAYATEVIGGFYSDYIGVLGSYYFVQNPSATKIAADKNKISLSNKQEGEDSALNKINSVYAGLLRNCRQVDIKITEDATGRLVYGKTEYCKLKSFSSGATIRPSDIKVDFDVLAHDLKNNTKYTVTLDAYIDYGENSEQKNKRSTFTFPLYIDFEAPLVTDVVYRTEYDRTTKKTKLFADISVYDNHYAMGMFVGQALRPSDPDSEYEIALSSFGKYCTPIYSSFNSTSTVTVELTDYVADIKKSLAIKLDEDGNEEIVENSNAFVVNVYDYAMNSATYQIQLPDEITSMYFSKDGEEVSEIKLSPNETLDLTTALTVYPDTSWIQTLDFKSDTPDVADVINQTLIAKQSGSATITATGHDAEGNEVTADVEVTVLREGDEGYVGGYTIPQVNRFVLTFYHTEKSYYGVTLEERELGEAGSDNEFGNDFTLSMYPSEKVTVHYSLDSYFPDNTSVVFEAGNRRVATVDAKGTIEAQAEGTTTVTASVRYNDRPTLYSQRISITVKDPFITNGINLNSYKGLGGVVEVPDDRGITTIAQYAFSNYEYVEKDVNAGDVIDEEDPLYIKPMYIGDNTITKVIIPDGVVEIQSYAFANLTALEEVVLPATLNKIGVGAFLGCEKLKTINLENVQFINLDAFRDCTALAEIKLDSIVAIGDYAFANDGIVTLRLPATSQSLGASAFRENTKLTTVQFEAEKIKIAPYVFYGCASLQSIDINTPVLASYAFANCSSLKDVTLGKDVAVIGEFAFAATNVGSFRLKAGNSVFELKNNNEDICRKGDNSLVLRAPAASSAKQTVTIEAENIEAGAFAGSTKIYKVIANNATTVGAYAFAGCTNLTEVEMPNLTEIGERAFYRTKLGTTPDLKNVTKIGDYAFAESAVTSVSIPDDAVVGEYAFYYCEQLRTVTIGDNVKLGTSAFANPIYYATYENLNDTAVFETQAGLYDTYTYAVNDENGEWKENMTFYRFKMEAASTSVMETLSIGSNVDIGESAFSGNIKLTTLTLGTNGGTKIGDGAFFNANKLSGSVDLSGVESIGRLAFAGQVTYDYYRVTGSTGRTSYIRARNFFYRGDDLYASAYVNSYFSPSFTQADLSNVKTIEEGAFAYNRSLQSVTLSQNLKEIAARTFLMCSALDEITIPESVTEIGEDAFCETAITTVDLSHVQKIETEAFAGCKLASVTLKEGAVIGNYAFSANEELSSVANLGAAKSVGDYAFTHCKIAGTLDLSAAEEIGDFAFAQNEGVTAVKLGEQLKKLGENPFYGCKIITFAKTASEQFNGKPIGDKVIADYDISDSVTVKGGVLYQKVDNGGLELISYPAAATAKSYVVAEDTVRISANAFADNESIENVTISYKVKSIGDKAFYGCTNLSLVVFTGYTAPILEEQFDENYANSSVSLPVTGKYLGYDGLGISKYFMWTLASSNNYYYGANFVDYVGKIGDNKNISIVRPSNGQNYDTFIMSQYFRTFIDGTAAANDDTLYVIALINALPANITLNDENAVKAARAAYDRMVINDVQKSLVTNYTTLTSAEQIIEYLKNRDNPDVNPDTPPAGGSTAGGNNATALIGYIIAGVALVSLVAYVVLTQVLKGKKAASAAAGDGGTQTAEESANADESAAEVENGVEESSNTEGDSTDEN